MKTIFIKKDGVLWDAKLFTHKNKVIKNKNMPQTLKYDLQDADRSGVMQHPQLQMKELGYKVTAMEGAPIGGCVFFEVDKIIFPLPEYLEISDYVIE